MKVMVLVKASPESEAGVMPSQQLLTDMLKFNEELAEAGVLLAADGLQPSSQGVRVRFSGKRRSVIDGPFTETKELVAGYWIWQVKSMDEAVAWLKRCPNPMESESDVEIRPLFEADDFGAAFTPELREQEARIRAQALGLGPLRFEDRGELQIAGLNESFTPETRGNIPAHWGRFAPHIGKVPGQVGGMTAYGVCWNFQEGCRFDYLCGVEVTSVNRLPGGFAHVRLPAQRYVVLTHSGHVSQLPKTLETIWKQWLPSSGYEAAKAPWFERYTEEYNPQTGLGGTEVWIPIQKTE